MIHKAKDLSQQQRAAIESLLGRAVAENEMISLRTIPPDQFDRLTDAAPAWLQETWKAAENLGLDRLSNEEIEAEIQAVRRNRLTSPDQ